jgi:hypothetical protein
MKYLYPLSLLLLLVACQKEEKKVIDRTKTDWAFYQLKGDVKSISLKSNLVDASLQKGKTQHENMSDHDTDLDFNKNGMLVREKQWRDATRPFEETTYNGRENKLLKLQYINNAVGIKTEYLWDKTGKNNTAITRRNTDNSQIDRIEMKYKDGHMIEKITYNAQNNPLDKVTYVYDSKGNLRGENIYLHSEYVQYKTKYDYDNKNRIVAESRYDKDSKPVYTTTYQYKGNNLIKKETTNEKKVVDYSEQFNYDPKGNMISHITFERYDNSNTVDKYIYDALGNKTDWTVLRNDVPAMKASFKYDDKNNLTATHAVDGSGKVIEEKLYKFEYDTQGNWTKKTVNINGKPAFVAERTITYFGEGDEE